MAIISPTLVIGMSLFVLCHSTSMRLFHIAKYNKQQKSKHIGFSITFTRLLTVINS